MSSIVIAGNTSGSTTLQPTDAVTTTLTLPSTSGTLFIAGQSSAIQSGTAQASTSGTNIDFTGIPSWAKRVTVMFNNVSTSGTSYVQVQIGTSGGVQTTGYSSYSYVAASANSVTTGFCSDGASMTAAALRSGQITLTLLDAATGTWCAGYSVGIFISPNTYAGIGGGSKALSGTLDRVRITTVNGTDTFDAGSINILYE